MKYDSVVLAAGFSSRTGSDKMVMSVGERTVLQRVLDTLGKACGQIIVVGGHHRQKTAKIVAGYINAKLVINEEYELGMFSSVKRGVREMTRDFFLIPGDYPLVKEETYEALAKSKADMAVPVYRGRKGHPVFIKKDLIEKILDEPIDSNLKVFRDRQKVEYIEVDDEGIIMDVDTLEDLLKIRKKAEGR